MHQSMWSSLGQIQGILIEENLFIRIPTLSWIIFVRISAIQGYISIVFNVRILCVYVYSKCQSLQVGSKCCVRVP